MAKGGLTPKQERFVQEYLIDLNATQAAIRAGYSAKTANEQGARLLANVSIAAAIAAKQEKLFDRYEVTADRIVRELALMGFSNMLDYVSIEGGEARVDLSAIDRDQAAAIQEVTVESVGGGKEAPIVRTKFKLASKQGALELLGRRLQLFSSEGDEALKEGLAELIRQRRTRANEAENVH
jgi:phage terminase small subunit